MSLPIRLRCKQYLSSPLSSMFPWLSMPKFLALARLCHRLFCWIAFSSTPGLSVWDIYLLAVIVDLITELGNVFSHGIHVI